MEQTHPDDTEHELLAEVFRTGKSKFSYKKRYITKDKRTIWVDMTITVVRDSSGNPMFSIGMAYDITEYHKGETDLKDSQDALRSRLCDSPRQVTIVDSSGRRVCNDRAIKSCWICLE